jgi:hypothetical protein
VLSSPFLPRTPKLRTSPTAEGALCMLASATCVPIAIDLAQYVGRFACQLRVLREQVIRICAAQSAVFQKIPRLIRECIDSERDCRHLRPEHICLEPDLAIIDCLEFSRDLRIVDTAGDLACLLWSVSGLAQLISPISSCALTAKSRAIAPVARSCTFIKLSCEPRGRHFYPTPKARDFPLFG